MGVLIEGDVESPVDRLRAIYSARAEHGQGPLGALVYPARGNTGFRVPLPRFSEALYKWDPNGEFGLEAAYRTGQAQVYPEGAGRGYIALLRLIESRWVLHGARDLRWKAVIPAKDGWAADKGRSRHTRPELWFTLDLDVSDGTVERKWDHWGVLHYTAPQNQTDLGEVRFTGPQATVILKGCEGRELHTALQEAYRLAGNTIFTLDLTAMVQALGTRVKALQFSDGPRFFVPWGACRAFAAVAGVYIDSTGKSMAMKANPVGDTDLDRQQVGDDAETVFTEALQRAESFAEQLRVSKLRDATLTNRVEDLSKDLDLLRFYETLLRGKWDTLRTRLESIRQTAQLALL